MNEESERLLWLEKEIVPKIAKALGKDADNIRCEIQVPRDSHFVSSVYIMELIFPCEAGTETEKMKLLAKMPQHNEKYRTSLNSDILFHNEIIFYERFGKNYDDYPKCVFILPKPISKAVIVLENVTKFGYKALQFGENLGMKPAIAAFQEIAKFHARGYVLKEKNPIEFFDVADNVREIYGNSTRPMMIEYINTVSQRPVNYLRSVNYDPVFCEKMSILLSNAHEKIFKDCFEIRNELAVLCHGDFTSNNVLFKENDGELKAMLIDFAQLRYASPATDVSTLLYLSCDDEVRKNFAVIFRSYHDSVLKYLKDQGIQDLEKYSFEAFFEDYKRHAIFGCEIAMFFMPFLHLGCEVDYDRVINKTSEIIPKAMVTGGDAFSKKLADMLLQLRDIGGLDHIL